MSGVGAFALMCSEGILCPLAIDDFISEWHELRIETNEGVSLHEWLGFSWEEYAEYVKSDTIPARLWVKCKPEDHPTK